MKSTTPVSPRNQRPKRPLAMAVLASLACLAAHAQTIERMRLTDGDLNCAQMYAEVQQMDTMIKVMGSMPAAPTAPPAYAGAGQYPGAIPANAPAGQQLNAITGVLGNGGTANDQTRQLMLMSNDPKVRAQANDPMVVAQVQAMLANPQAAVALQRAQAGGVSSASMQNSMNLLGAAQMAANNAQQAGVGAAAAPAPSTAQNALGSLFGALAARGNSGGGSQAAAGLFGSFLGQQQAPQAAPQPMAAPAPIAAQAVPAGGGQIVAQAQARKDHLTGLFLSKGCKLSDVQR